MIPTMLVLMLYVAVGWVLVYRDLLPRMVDAGFHHVEEYPDVYDSRVSQKELIREYKTWGLVMMLALGFVFPAYFAFVWVKDKTLDVPITEREKEVFEG